MRFTNLLAVSTLALGLAAGTAQAEYVVTLTQVGNDVVATGSGSLNITALSLTNQGYNGGLIHPSAGEIIMGPSPSGADEFGPGVSGPSSLGSSNAVFTASSASTSGGVVGIAFGQLFVPGNYVSGTELAPVTDTYSDTTLAQMGIGSGTYQWTWGSGANADMFTLQVGAVPEPGSLLVLSTGLAALSVRRRRRSNR